MDHDIRSRLVDALGKRRWTHIDAERAADCVAGLYQAGEGEWQVWPGKKTAGSDHCRVARRADAVSVYDSPQDGRAWDVAHALNELERQNSVATATH